MGLRMKVLMFLLRMVGEGHSRPQSRCVPSENDTDSEPRGREGTLDSTCAMPDVCSTVKWKTFGKFASLRFPSRACSWSEEKVEWGDTATREEATKGENGHVIVDFHMPVRFSTEENTGGGRKRHTLQNYCMRFTAHIWLQSQAVRVLQSATRTYLQRTAYIIRKDCPQSFHVI